MNLSDTSPEKSCELSLRGHHNHHREGYPGRLLKNRRRPTCDQNLRANKDTQRRTPAGRATGACNHAQETRESEQGGEQPRTREGVPCHSPRSDSARDRQCLTVSTSSTSTEHNRLKQAYVRSEHGEHDTSWLQDRTICHLDRSRPSSARCAYTGRTVPISQFALVQYSPLFLALVTGCLGQPQPPAFSTGFFASPACLHTPMSNDSHFRCLCWINALDILRSTMTMELQAPRCGHTPTPPGHPRCGGVGKISPTPHIT